MKIRWLDSTFILLTVIAVLASSPFPGHDSGTMPLSVPVDEEGFEKEVEKDLDESSNLGFLVSLSTVGGDIPSASGPSCEDATAVDVLHNRCFGTRGPPVVFL